MLVLTEIENQMALKLKSMATIRNAQRWYLHIQETKVGEHPGVDGEACPEWKSELRQGEQDACAGNSGSRDEGQIRYKGLIK